jgi:hypothetical protein
MVCVHLEPELSLINLAIIYSISCGAIKDLVCISFLSFVPETRGASNAAEPVINLKLGGDSSQATILSFWKEVACGTLVLEFTMTAPQRYPKNLEQLVFF